MSRLISKEQVEKWCNGEATIEAIAKEMGRHYTAVSAMLEMTLGTDTFLEAMKKNRQRTYGTEPVILDDEDLKGWFMHEIGYRELRAKYKMGAEKVAQSLKLSAEKFYKDLELLRNPPQPVVPEKVEFKKVTHQRVDLLSDMDLDRLNNKTVTIADLSRELGCNYATLFLQYKRKLEKLREEEEKNKKVANIIAARGEL